MRRVPQQLAAKLAQRLQLFLAPLQLPASALQRRDGGPQAGFHQPTVALHLRRHLVSDDARFGPREGFHLWPARATGHARVLLRQNLDHHWHHWCCVQIVFIVPGR